MQIRKQLTESQDLFAKKTMINGQNKQRWTFLHLGMLNTKICVQPYN